MFPIALDNALLVALLLTLGRFTLDDRAFIASSLRLAAEHYETDADGCSRCQHDDPAVLTRLSALFSYHADKARILAARLENVDEDY